MADKESNEQKPQRIEHSRGGISSRDDALDEGVPMLQGDSKEIRTNPWDPRTHLDLGRSVATIHTASHRATNPP
jgi:hypothetical protein